MNKIFQNIFRAVITHSYVEQNEIDLMDTTPDEADDSKKKKKRKVTLQFLEQYSKERWESVLMYMVGTSTVEEKPKFLDSIEKLLNWSQLVQVDEHTSRAHVTAEGFQFLLQETRTQVWKLLKQYLDSSESRKQIQTEILQFLFALSFMRVGHGYLNSNLTPSQTVMLLDLSELGIVYLKHPKFYPTPMVMGITQGTSDSGGRVSMLDDLMGNGPGLSVDDSHSGHIVVETNYRIYAYTRSSLQIALLSLFTFLEYRLPNMVVGMITRESVREAFKNGITADQILGYLYLHAHPQMRKRRPVIPETVADQIRLWEAERNRVHHDEGVLYDKFPNREKFDLVVAYSRQASAHLWSGSGDEKLMLVVKRESHDVMKNFIKQNV
jgi:transcription initiation factor TFIIH subunit 4